MYKNIPDMILPMLWFEEGSRMTQELADEIKPALFFADSWVIPLLFSLMLIAGVVVLAYASYTLHNLNKKKQVVDQERTSDKSSISSSHSFEKK